MLTTRELVAQMYAAFNRRDIESALKFMSDTVSWPKASEGGRVVGKDEIRSYWTRQWAEFDPHVEPVRIEDSRTGTVDVDVHQVVKDRKGNALSDSTVRHVYTLAHGRIERMDIQSEGKPAFGTDHRQ